MPLVIHIGLQKTGTTFIQRALFNNRQQLKDFGVLYNPAAGLEETNCNAHHFIPHALKGKRFSYTPKDDFSRVEDHALALREEAAAHPDMACVISSEDFSLIRNREKLQKLRNFFPDDDTRILVYLRRQDAWIDSLYGQMIKVGRKQSVEEFVSAEEKTLNYGGFLARWSSEFGQKNIVVRAYEPGGDFDLWHDFMKSIGRDEAAKVAPGITSANDSLPPELALFAKSVFNYDNAFRKHLESIAHLYPVLPGLKFLTPEIAGKILKECSETNRKVAEEYLGRKDLFKDTKPLPYVGQGELSNSVTASILSALNVQLLRRITKLERAIKQLQEDNKPNPPNDLKPHSPD